MNFHDVHPILGVSIMIFIQFPAKSGAAVAVFQLSKAHTSDSPLERVRDLDIRSWGAWVAA